VNGLGTTALLVALLVPVLAAVLALVARRAPDRTPRILLGVATAGAAVAAASTAAAPVEVAGGTAGALLLDRVASVVLLGALVVGWAAVTQAVRSIDVDGERRRTVALACVLVAGTALVAVASGALALAVGWIGSGAALVALLARRGSGGAAGAARRRVARSLVVGDVALVAALALVVAATGSWQVAGGPSVAGSLASSSPMGLPAADVVAVLLVVAGVARSALVPFHRWLAPTVAAPTPVSVLLHAGFIGGAGVLVLRTAPVVTSSAVATHLLLALALATVVVGTLARRVRVDAKGELAWSTVAQMGFMGAQAAVGAFGGVLFHLVGHGLYKASRFLTVGDAPAAALARRRSPVVAAPPAPPVRTTLAVTLPAAGIGLGWWATDPGLDVTGSVLVASFAWAAAARALRAALVHTPATLGALAPVLLAGLAVPAAYVVALASLKALVGPDLPVAGGGAVGLPVLLVLLAAVVGTSALVRFWPGPTGERLRRGVSLLALDLADDRPPASPRRLTTTTTTERELA
jgi:NADH:ubiquinone oxidoreductase subunit 2 (subunit N)